MASATNKLLIDDTQPLNCQILSTETESDHTVYIVRVQRGIDSKYSWQIRKRYNDFNDLNSQLKLANYELPLPPKKAFGNMKREFLSSRQIGLQEFLEKMLENSLLANTLIVKQFLDPENYSENFKELALAHVSMFFRSEPSWQIVEPLNEIGWRFRKKHILLKNSDMSNSKFLLTWCEHGPDKLLKEADLKTIFQQFTQIQHELIEPIVRIHSFEQSTIVIQRFNEKTVSLRDFLCGQTKINTNYLKKYGLQKSYQQLNPQTIKQISKKVLLALEFIYSKGLFYGHLHSGNVLIDLANMTNVKLTDLPNALIGVPYLYRSNVVEQRKIQTIELTDVYGLGQLIYEMCYGEAMFNRGVKTNFEDCPNPEIKSILNLLLSEEALAKSTLPTINQLLEMPFFKDVNVNTLSSSSLSAAASTQSTSNSHSKLLASSKVKECLGKAREFMEKKLNDEQKTVYKFRRQSNAEAKVLSEEEVKKRRREKKKAEKEALLNNSLEFPTPPTSPSASSSIPNRNSAQQFDSFPPSSSLSSPTSITTPKAPQQTPVTSTKNSSAGPPPPPPGPPPPPPPPPSMSAPPPPPAPLLAASGSADRSQLLSSINNFSKNGLKKTKTNDRSGPLIK